MTKCNLKKKKHHWVSETKKHNLHQELVWVLHNGRSPSCSNQWSCTGPRVCIWAQVWKLENQFFLPEKDGSWWNPFCLHSFWVFLLHPPKSRNQSRRENSPPNQIPRVSTMLRLWFDSCNWTHDPGQCLSSSEFLPWKKKKDSKFKVKLGSSRVRGIIGKYFFWYTYNGTNGIIDFLESMKR